MCKWQIEKLMTTKGNNPFDKISSSMILLVPLIKYLVTIIDQLDFIKCES